MRAPHAVAGPLGRTRGATWPGGQGAPSFGRGGAFASDRVALERALHTYVDHYNSHRPHRGLGLVPPQPRPAPRLAAPADPLRIHRRDRLGGLIHEYSAAVCARPGLRTPQDTDVRECRSLRARR
jgi:hypothetical protein